MRSLNQRGAIDGFLVPFIITLLLLIGAAAFGVWAYQGRQDYKNNVDQKIGSAVTVAKQQESTTKDKQFAEASKYPFKTYKGPDAYGSLVVNFPRTWSAYVNDTGSNSGTVVDGYFYPNVVPYTNDQNVSFALRVQIIAQSYSDVVANLQNNRQDNPPTIKPYSPPKLPNVVGIRLDGQINQNINGSMVVLPLRDKTLELWTEAQQYENDFNNNILPNFTFSP